MGTNRRSRRRSAARILNPSIQSKKQRTTSELELEGDGDYVDLTQPNSPDSSGHANNVDQLDNTDLTQLPPRTIPHNGIKTNTQIESNDHFNLVPKFTPAEICSFELMDLLDNAGCPLNTYEHLICLLRKQEKLGFSYSRAHSCDKLLSLEKSSIVQVFIAPQFQNVKCFHSHLLICYKIWLIPRGTTFIPSLHLRAMEAMMNCGTASG